MGKIENLNPEQEPQKEIVSLEESEKLAKELLNRYKNELTANLYKDVDGWGEPYSDYQKSIRHFLEKIPEDVRERFQGHGITKKSALEQLAGTLNILANKSIKGECGPLGGKISSASIGAYMRGDFLVISKVDKKLAVMEEKDGRRQPISNKIGWLADIGALVVDVRYYPLVEELKKLFPDMHIIKANEIQEFIKTQIESAQ